MRRTALIILDGWGHREETERNAVHAARTPSLDALCRDNPYSTLGASGRAVGLPEGQMGNSEVGHLNLGAGRIVYQDFTRINMALEDGSFFDNAQLREVCGSVNRSGGALHLMGLLSDGGVHSHQEHLYALIELAKRAGVERVCVHAFLDGRDTPPRSGLGYVEALEGVLAEMGLGRIATVGGRFYAMDRDTRWERVRTAYDALCRGEGVRVAAAADGVRNAYAQGQTDEFVTPCVVCDGEGTPVGLVRDGDGIVFFNFRADRARQLTRVFTQEGFNGFDVSDRPQLAGFVAFTEYDETFTVPVAFPPVSLKRIFAQVLSENGAKQLRIAETEKYAHVTFFFNGGVEHAYPGEQRVLIPSPREVSTYDEKPEMSAYGVRDRLLEEIAEGGYDSIVVNFANLDMVGHTGIMEAAVAAVQVVDACVGELVEALREAGYAVLVTADHGNAEQMWDGDADQPMTAHTLNRVPCILVDEARKNVTLREEGILADVAPTLLELMGMEIPEEMTGTSLLRS